MINLYTCRMFVKIISLIDIETKDHSLHPKKKKKNFFDHKMIQGAC